MRIILCVLMSALLADNSVAAVRGEHSAYVGGTVSNLKQGVEGVLDTSDPKVLRFDYADGQFSLLYRQIATLEFGEKVGRRVGAALGGMVALGLPGLLILMSKKKKHFLTIGYRNESGEGQAAVFELAKGTVSSIIPAMEARTGIRCETEPGEGFEAGHADAPHVPLLPPQGRIAQITTLTVESNPPGAEVFVHAKSLGPAPVTATLPPGSKYIVMRREGFETWTREIDAKAGQTTTITAELKRIQEVPNVIIVRPTGK